MYVNQVMALDLAHTVAAREENARKHPSKANARALDAARAELREVCDALEAREPTWASLHPLAARTVVRETLADGITGEVLGSFERLHFAETDAHRWERGPRLSEVCAALGGGAR